MRGWFLALLLSACTSVVVDIPVDIPDDVREGVEATTADLGGLRADLEPQCCRNAQLSCFRANCPYGP